MTRPDKPQIDDAPGLVWRPRKDGWAATWQARTDIAERGFMPQNITLWAGTELSDFDRQQIAFVCTRYQADMLLWAKGGPPLLNRADGTLGGLIKAYQKHTHSSYRKLRYHVRINHDNVLKRIVERCGDAPLYTIKGVLIMDWHEAWSADGKISTGHILASQLRTLFGFGASILEDPECARLKGVMSGLKFPQARPREERLTAEQVIAIRARAHYMGWGSIALAQAFQFECTMRQKDVIGEWVPVAEPGVTDVIGWKGKWLRGIRWEEIDANLILKHTTSKKEKPIVVNLKLAPFVMDEFEYQYGLNRVGPPNRDKLPTKGPIIVAEFNLWPYTAAEFRRKWRIVGDGCGIPKNVWNMDSRAGAISEATNAGVPLEHVRHAAAHSQVSMTARYSRDSEEKIESTMTTRAESRNKPKT